MLMYVDTLLHLLVILLPVAALTKQQYDGYEPYLAPHEKRVFDALDNMDKDFNQFLDIFAENARCELTFGKDPKDVTTQSGPCDDVFLHVGSDLVYYKLNWHTLTNSHPDHPERGVLSMKFGNYGLTNKGCEGMWSGIGAIKFNKSGQVTYLGGHSSEMLEFLICMEEDEKESESIHKEEMYLAPHEQDVFDALVNIHKDPDAIKSVLAENAQCDFISGGRNPADILVKSGSCIDLWGGDEWDKLIYNKIKWKPVTNSHDMHPDRGLLTFEFWQFASAEEGCESLFDGAATVKFNEDGFVTDANVYSDGFVDFLGCLEEIRTRA